MHARYLLCMLLLTGIALLVCGCAPRVAVGAANPPGLPDTSAFLGYGICDWLAGVSGLAAIAVVIVFVLGKEYIAALVAALCLVCLAACFLALPAVVKAFTWAVLVCLGIAVIGVAYLVVTRVRHPDATLNGFIKRIVKK